MKDTWFKRWFLQRSSIELQNQLEPAEPPSVENSVGFRIIWLLVYIITAVVSFYLGVGVSSGELNVMQMDFAETKRLYATQIAELEELRRERIILERNVWIGQQTAEQLRQDIIRLGDEKSAMAREIRFYRNVIDPERAQEGVSIYSAEVRPTDDPRLFQWRMVVVQNAAVHKVQTGEVRATIQGFKGDQPMSLPIKFDVDGKAEESLNVKFRYFENIPRETTWGIVELPAGFEPVSIDTEVRLTSPTRKTIKNTFEWLVDDTDSG